MILVVNMSKHSKLSILTRVWDHELITKTEILPYQAYVTAFLQPVYF